MARYWIMLIAVGVVALFFVAGYATHPRLHVKRVQDSRLISRKYQHLFGRDAITRATKKGEPPP